jgi:lipopolysaccharide export system protein LptC
MTHSTEAVRLDMRDTGPAARRGETFREAMRHSARVRFLRRAILVGCLGGLAGIIAFSMLDPFGKLPQNLSIAQAGLNGTRITMQLPKLSGYRPDGNPYDVRAASGVQDIRHPNIIELNEIEARFDTADKMAVHLVAPEGTYDSSRDFMTMRGNVRITTDSGYDIRMTKADMDVRNGSVVSDEPITVTMSGATIRADRLDIRKSGHEITFEGNVRTAFKSAARAAGGISRGPEK